MVDEESPFPLNPPDPSTIVKWEKMWPERFYVLPTHRWFDEEDYSYYDWFND